MKDKADGIQLSIIGGFLFGFCSFFCLVLWLLSSCCSRRNYSFSGNQQFPHGVMITTGETNKNGPNKVVPPTYEETVMLEFREGPFIITNSKTA